MTQKHTKKDFEVLNKLTVKDIFDIATVQPKK